MSAPESLRALVRVILLLPLLLALSACGSSRVEPGTYRAVLEIPGGDLPFGLVLAQEGGRWIAELVNGTRSVRVTDVQLDGGSLKMSMPGYLNRISLSARRGRLQGQFVLVGPGGKETRIALSAHRGTHRFFEQPLTDNADLSGRWALTLTDAEGRTTPAIAELRQKFHEVNGTFRTTTGDYGDLAGEVRDDALYLSTFDGGRAWLVHARLTPRDQLQGTLWSASGTRHQFTARRDEGAALQDPYEITRIRDDTWTLGFTFPDETGKAISLADARFRGRVVVVTLTGSWCPNGQEAAAWLAPFYKERHDRGFEAVGLMFEHSRKFESAAEAVRRLRAAHAVEFPTLIAGISDKAAAAAEFPQLNGVHAFPTTLFIDRRARVRRIHTGFDGPATGPHYEEMTAQFASTVDELLAEPARQPEAD